MDNETKLSREQINSIKKDLANQKGNVDIKDFMTKHLDEKQQQAVSALLSDPQKLRSLMNSPLAKSLMEKFGKQEKE